MIVLLVCVTAICFEKEEEWDDEEGGEVFHVLTHVQPMVHDPNPQTHGSNPFLSLDWAWALVFLQFSF
jgi:hypothetical protein